MSDAKRLQDKLAKLTEKSAATHSGNREINTARETGFRLAVLQEIDETILGRNLIFQNENNKGFTLEAANRRLHRVIEFTLNSAENSFDNLIGQQFFEQDIEQTSRFAELLDAFFEGSQKYFVHSKRLNQTPDPENVGCAASVLATALSVDLYEKDIEAENDHSEEKLVACIKLATSWVRFDATGIVKSAGDLSGIHHLKSLIKHDMSQFDQRLDDSFGTSARFVVLGPDMSKGHLILYLKASKQGAYLILKTQNLPELQSLWHSS